MQVNNGKNFWAGLMFLAFGLAFALVAAFNYNMGTAVRMGPAYFPVMLGGLLAVLGLAVFISSFKAKYRTPDVAPGEELKVFRFRPLIFVIGCLCGVAAYYLRNGSDVFYQLFTAACLILVQAAFGAPALYIILASVVIFAFLLKPLGLLLATAVLVVVSRVNTEHFGWSAMPTSIIFGLLMYVLFGVLMAVLQGPIGVGYAGIVAMLVIIGVSIFAGRKMPSTEVGALFAILGVFCVVIFGHALGLPFNACPDALDDACRKIGLGS